VLRGKGCSEVCRDTFSSGSQFLDPDGTFPNHIPNPEEAAAMEATTKAVLENNADLGICFDTDVDRSGAPIHNGD
jgi:phosphomannomutase